MRELLELAGALILMLVIDFSAWSTLSLFTWEMNSLRMRTGTDPHWGLGWSRWSHSLGRTHHKVSDAIRDEALGVFIPSESCDTKAELQSGTSFIHYGH